MIEQIKLERLPVWSRSVVSMDVLNGAKVDAYRILDETFEGMRIELRAHVLAEHVGGVSHEFSYPKDWWQAFKDRWFPKWALKRWPVEKTRKVWNVDIKCAYPYFRPALSGEPYRPVYIPKHVESK